MGETSGNFPKCLFPIPFLNYIENANLRPEPIAVSLTSRDLDFSSRTRELHLYSEIQLDFIH